MLESDEKRREEKSREEKRREGREEMSERNRTE